MAFNRTIWADWTACKQLLQEGWVILSYGTGPKPVILGRA